MYVSLSQPPAEDPSGRLAADLRRLLLLLVAGDQADERDAAADLAFVLGFSVDRLDELAADQAARLAAAELRITHLEWMLARQPRPLVLSEN